MTSQNNKTMTYNNVLEVPIDEVPDYILIKQSGTDGGLPTILFNEIEKVFALNQDKSAESVIDLNGSIIRVMTSPEAVQLMTKLNNACKFLSNKIELLTKDQLIEAKGGTFNTSLYFHSREDYISSPIVKTGFKYDIVRIFKHIAIMVVLKLKDMVEEEKCPQNVKLFYHDSLIYTFVSLYKHFMFIGIVKNRPKTDFSMSDFNEELMEHYEKKWEISQEYIEQDTFDMKSEYSSIKSIHKFLCDTPKKKTRRGGKKHKK